MTTNTNRLYRSKDDKMITGLCGGIAEQYNLDPGIVRILTLLMILFTFPLGLVAYFVAALIIPSEGETENIDQSTLEDVDEE